MQGILVATDENLEWLLPWWWARYSTHNSYPVAFVDFGMSRFGREFCAERGQLLSLDVNIPWFEQEKNRKGWVKKPFAMLHTPFEKTLWLDMDCEVLGSLEPLFSLECPICLAPDTERAHARERELKTIEIDETLYNSGVIFYRRNFPLIQKWAQQTEKEGHHFFSDQHVLSRIIHREKISITPLHENYNWRMSQGLNIHAVIVHWAGSWGKEYIRLHGGIADELNILMKI